MKTLISFIIVAEIAASVFLFGYQPIVSTTIPEHVKVDTRVAKLETFERRHNFAKPYLTNDYIKSADTYNLDFRFLPCISLLESSGGRHYPVATNNEWGYGSSDGLYSFASIPAGIAFISDKLANGKYYRGKSLEQKVHTYNSANPNYWPNLERCMDEIH